jgi:hypothetical protein
MNTSYEQLITPQLLDSRLKLHLVLQFLIHPQLATTATTLSERLRENPWAVAEALSELAEQHLLASVMHQGRPVYRLGSDVLHRAKLALLLEDFNDPQKRDHIHALVRAAHDERQYHSWLAGDERVVGQQMLLVA